MREQRVEIGKQYIEQAKAEGVELMYDPADEPEFCDDVLRVIGKPNLYIQIGTFGGFSAVEEAGDGFYFEDAETFPQALEKIKEMQKSA
jgi:hypothetical protein